MMTYTNIIEKLDNMNYVGKKGQPIKKVEYRADITITTNTHLYTRTVFNKTHLGLMRDEQNVINNLMRSEWSKYNRDVKNGWDIPKEPELIDVKIVETDRDGNISIK